METTPEQERQVEKIGRAISNIVTSQQFVDMMQQPDMDLIIRCVAGYVAVASKKFTSKTHRNITYVGRLGLVFVIGYLLGQQAVNLSTSKAPVDEHSA